MTYVQYVDHYDEEDGYRAYLASDDDEMLSRFYDWLERHDLNATFDYIEDESHDSLIQNQDNAVWTDWITDKGKAALLKLTWGGFS